MRKTIALLNDDPKLFEMCQETERVIASFVERKKFLDKQQDDLVEEGRKTVGACVDRMEIYLEAQGKMPKEFNKNKHHTHIDVESNMVYICDGADHGPTNIQEAIAKALGLT